MTEKELNFAVLVVIYNQHCLDSLTCKALLQFNRKNVSVFVFDNSTSDYGNQLFCEQNGWCYLSGNGNVGLSKAYNASLDVISKDNSFDFVCLFDDDTKLNENYFDCLENAAENEECDIFVPLISAQGYLISPCRLDEGYRSTMFDGEASALNYEGNDLSAINSCMAIRTKVFDEFRYDENLFLDGIDHFFMTEMLRKKHRRCFVFPYRCEHSFSGVEVPTYEKAYGRFCIYVKDYAFLLQKKKLSFIKLVGKRTLYLCIKYRSISFLIVFLKNLF